MPFWTAFIEALSVQGVGRNSTVQSKTKPKLSLSFSFKLDNGKKNPEGSGGISFLAFLKTHYN